MLKLKGVGSLVLERRACCPLRDGTERAVLEEDIVCRKEEVCVATEELLRNLSLKFLLLLSLSHWLMVDVGDPLLTHVNSLVCHTSLFYAPTLPWRTDQCMDHTPIMTHFYSHAIIYYSAFGNAFLL